MQTDQNRGRDLDPLGNTLRRTLRETAGPSPEETNPRQETKTEECTCSCGKTFMGEVTTYYFFKPPRVIRDTECPDCRQAREAEEKRLEEEAHRAKVLSLRERWKRTCGIPARFQGVLFADLDPGYQPKAQKDCRKWAESFDVTNTGEIQSLLLYSPTPGVGKSLLVSCIGNHIIENWYGDPAAPCPVRFVSGPGLVRRIRSTFDIRDTDVGHEREQEVYEKLGGVRLLILDDVGKEQPRSYRFTQEIYWYIINERVNAQLPIVINSRLPLTGEGSLEELMGEDTVDRLYGMTGGRIIQITGQSYRRMKKQP